MLKEPESTDGGMHRLWWRVQSPVGTNKNADQAVGIFDIY
jgi:hypothetical protein